MAQVTILTERELRHLVKLDSAVIKAVGNGFRALATQAVQMPPPLRLDLPEHNGEVDVKTAYVPGIPSFALKVSPGFFNNPAIGLPSLNGLMILCSATTGLVEAILFDNGYLTDIHTAAAGAIAADHLARQNAVRVGIVGAGAQARLQLAALLLVRPIEAVMIWARDRVKADAFAALCGREFALATGVTDTVEALCAASDIVVTTTPSTTRSSLDRHCGLGCI
jgi:ornithine cyclodeaminase